MLLLLLSFMAIFGGILVDVPWLTLAGIVLLFILLLMDSFQWLQKPK